MQLKTQSKMERAIIQHNPIEALVLPPGWFEDMPDSGPLPGSMQKNFHMLSAPTAEIFLWFRGMPIDFEGAKNLQQLLSERPQILTKSKIDRIVTVLGNMGIESIFKPLMIRTEAISKVNVLTVEGRWATGKDVYALFIPESAGSRVIFEVHYQAPSTDFRKNLASVRAAFASIEWSPA